MRKLIDEYGIYATYIVTIWSVITFFLFTPYGKGMLNTYIYNEQKVDDSTNYETIKEVENTCRAMISFYESDKLVYKQYKDSESEEKQSWAEQAKMRANKTATTYNNYILNNSFVWKDNIPSDIYKELEIIE